MFYTCTCQLCVPVPGFSKNTQALPKMFKDVQRFSGHRMSFVIAGTSTKCTLNVRELRKVYHHLHGLFFSYTGSTDTRTITVIHVSHWNGHPLSPMYSAKHPNSSLSVFSFYATLKGGSGRVGEKG